MLFGGNSGTDTNILVRSRRILLLYRRYNENNNHSTTPICGFHFRANQRPQSPRSMHEIQTELNEKRRNNNNSYTNALKLSIECKCKCVCESCLLRSGLVSVVFAVVNENRHRRRIPICCVHTYLYVYEFSPKFRFPSTV